MISARVVSWVLAREFFDGAWTFEPLIPLATIAGFLVLTGLTVYSAIRRVTREDMRHAARRHLRADRFTGAVIGPEAAGGGE